MGLLNLLKRLLGHRDEETFGESMMQAQGLHPVAAARPGGRKDMPELARRLGLSVEQLTGVNVQYRRFEVPKRSGGTRTLEAPADGLKAVQRTILRRLLGRLRAHEVCHGYERGRCIATNAAPHVGAAVTLKLDIRDFFPTTAADRVEAYFRAIGWDRKASALLTRLTTNGKGLPQGAPTSPRLANLVNFPMDARLAGLARKLGATYTRYADDMTFSWPAEDRARRILAEAIGSAKAILREYGYTMHHARKLRVARAHQRMLVTGLVVNRKLALPRTTRRWLRAVEHRLEQGGPATLTRDQLAGWQAYQAMIQANAR